MCLMRMRRLSAVALLLVMVATPGDSILAARDDDDDGSKLVGNWSGESICVGYRPACHDEKVVYRVVKFPEKPGVFVITMDKIVDGKPETMSVLDFKYDAGKKTLVGEFTRRSTHGIWEFTVKGDLMEGTLTILPDKTVGRRVKVTKEG
jgi:hypothetical protein